MREYKVNWAVKSWFSSQPSFLLPLLELAIPLSKIEYGQYLIGVAETGAQI